MVMFNFALWLLFVASTSAFEAIVFRETCKAKKAPINKHVPLTIMRAIVAYLCFKDAPAYIVVAVLSFPYLHDGFYYYLRSKMDKSVYPKGWKDESTTTDAKISLTYKQRLTLFILAICSLSIILLLSK